MKKLNLQVMGLQEMNKSEMLETEERVDPIIVEGLIAVFCLMALN